MWHHICLLATNAVGTAGSSNSIKFMKHSPSRTAWLKVYK